MPEPNVLSIVNDFVEHYHQGDIEIRKEASEQFRSDNGRTMHFSDYLIEAMHNYLISKNDLEAIEQSDDINFNEYQPAKKEYARWAGETLYWITELRALGFIGESESMKSKLDQIRKENKQLKEQIDQLTQKNLELKQLNDELNKVLGNFGEHGNSSFVEGKP